MSLPTLLKKGMLVPHMNESNLDNLIPANYIIDYIAKLNEKKNNLTNSDRIIIIL